MKKENSTLSKKLKQYSALAGSMLAVAGIAEGQVVYTDIPDTVFTPVNAFPGDTYALDLNNDGTTDFNFVAWKYSSSGGSHYAAFGLIMVPHSASNPNGIIGTVAGTANNLLGMVSQLALNDQIGTDPAAFFEYADLINNPSGYNIPSMLSTSNGNVAGKWQAGETDHFVGLKFSVGANNYFGWVRVDVDSNDVDLIVSSITIKDYAYNATPDAPLFAGQGSPLGVASANQPGNFNILGYEGVASIFVNDGKPGGTVVTVTNMLGQTIVKQSLSNRTASIDLNHFGKGIYLVTLQRGEEVFSKKISFR